MSPNRPNVQKKSVFEAWPKWILRDSAVENAWQILVLDNKFDAIAITWKVRSVWGHSFHVISRHIGNASRRANRSKLMFLDTTVSFGCHSYYACLEINKVINGCSSHNKNYRKCGSRRPVYSLYGTYDKRGRFEPFSVETMDHKEEHRDSDVFLS